MVYNMPVRAFRSLAVVRHCAKTPKGELTSPDTDAREKATISA